MEEMDNKIVSRQFISTLLLVCVVFISCKKFDVERLMSVETGEITEITSNSAIVTVNIIDLGEGVTDYGVKINTTTDVEAGTYMSLGEIDRTGKFKVTFNSLKPNVTYYVRAYVMNNDKHVLGSIKNFTTGTNLPILTTLEVRRITTNSANCGGEILTNGGTEIIARGMCWNNSPDPSINNKKTVDGTGTGIFNSIVINLNASTIYYFRAYATNSAGTAYGNERTFRSADTDNTIMDYEGNKYNAIVIGNQTWLQENLKSLKMNDGTSIPNLTDADVWIDLTTPGYCWYNNNNTFKDTYGALYNWYTVNTQKLCPTGWHVPNNDEWTTLVNYLGGWEYAGGKLRETGNIHWDSPSESYASNSTGFTSLPGGHRDHDGSYNGQRFMARYWTSTPIDTENANLWADYSTGSGVVNHQLLKRLGVSVRCVKD